MNFVFCSIKDAWSLDKSGTRRATRRDIMKVLQKLDYILIKSYFNSYQEDTRSVHFSSFVQSVPDIDIFSLVVVLEPSSPFLIIFNFDCKSIWCIQYQWYIAHIGNRPRCWSWQCCIGGVVHLPICVHWDIMRGKCLLWLWKEYILWICSHDFHADWCLSSLAAVKYSHVLNRTHLIYSIIHYYLWKILFICVRYS